jgi:hypothetical protein
VDLDDRAADAECGSLDRIADGERRGDRGRLLERVELALGACSMLARAPEAAVASPFCVARGRRRTLDRLLTAAGLAHFLAERGQLGARVCEVRPRLHDRALAFGSGRCLHPLDLRGERRFAPPRLLGRRPRGPVLAGSIELSALATISASRPSRSAVWSACEVPARPTTIRYSGSWVAGSIAVAAFAAASTALAQSFNSE